MSLVELMVAVALSGIVLVGGAGLLIRLLQQASTEVGREPAAGAPVDVAVQLVERDLRQARRLPRSDGRWLAGPTTLLLLLPDQQRVVYHRDGGRLLRLTAMGEAAEYRQRLLLDHVLTAEYSRRDADAGTFDIWLRQEGGAVRHRVVLARNLGRDVVGLRR